MHSAIFANRAKDRPNRERSDLVRVSLSGLQIVPTSCPNRVYDLLVIGQPWRISVVSTSC